MRLMLLNIDTCRDIANSKNTLPVMSTENMCFWKLKRETLQQADTLLLLQSPDPQWLNFHRSRGHPPRAATSQPPLNHGNRITWPSPMTSWVISRTEHNWSYKGGVTLQLCSRLMERSEFGLYRDNTAVHELELVVLVRETWERQHHPDPSAEGTDASYQAVVQL